MLNISEFIPFLTIFYLINTRFTKVIFYIEVVYMYKTHAYSNCWRSFFAGANRLMAFFSLWTMKHFNRLWNSSPKGNSSLEPMAVYSAQNNWTRVQKGLFRFCVVFEQVWLSSHISSPLFHWYLPHRIIKWDKKFSNKQNVFLFYSCTNIMSFLSFYWR